MLLDPNRRSRSVTPESRENQTTPKEMQCMKMLNMERVRMREVWTRIEKEQRALLDTKDGMTNLMAKATSDLWRLKQQMECLMKGFEN